MIPGQLSLEGEGGPMCIRPAHQLQIKCSVGSDLSKHRWRYFREHSMRLCPQSRLIVLAPYMGEKTWLLLDQRINQATKNGRCIIDSYVCSLAKKEADRVNSLIIPHSSIVLPLPGSPLIQRRRLVWLSCYCLNCSLSKIRRYE
jgi:hypothetical protein